VKTEIIGGKEFHYNNIKDLFYYVAKTFYYDYSKHFTTVILKNGDKKENAVFIDIHKKGQPGFYVDMSPLKYDEWNWIVSKLKKEFPEQKPIDLFDKSVTVNYTEELRKEFRKKIKRIHDTSKTGILLKYAPIDENGFSETVYFEEIKLINSNDAEKVGTNNGVGWRRTAVNYFNLNLIKEKGTTIGYQFNGFNIHNEDKNRLIRPDIRKTFNDCRCAHCWSPNSKSTKHEIDHKNGRYNKSEVFKYETQQIDDFQALCPSDNKLKRTSCGKCKDTGIRFDATFLGYNISVTEGTREYTEELGCVGCYWYDCNDFKSKLGTIQIKTNE
jgi:hypothetical protein